MRQKLKCRHRRGIMFVDAVAGLILITALATVLAVSVNRQIRGEQKLADLRTATRIAEQTLAELRLAGKTSPTDKDTEISIRPADGGWQPQGQQWVEVRIMYRGQVARLRGLVLDSSLPKEGRRP